MLKNINKSLDFLTANTKIRPATGIVLGTGLGGLVKKIEVTREFNYSEIPHFPVSTVEGHEGKLVFGRLGQRPVVAMQGRFHYYEGYSMQEVTLPIRVLNGLGIKEIILSNAAGGINPDFNIGDLMLIKDHINLFPDNPLRGRNEPKLGPRFPDMTEPYSQVLSNMFRKIASNEKVKLLEGVYVGNAGPSFETPAEYTFYRTIGGDAVGMSTIPEVIVARHMDLPVLALSVITNLAVPGKFTTNSHVDVQAAALLAEKNLIGLISKLMIELDDHKGPKY